MRRTAALMLLVFLLGITMTAQEITGTIVGNVKDASGSVIPNATVVVTNTDKNIVVRSLTTNQSGDYVATLLPIGHYSIEVSAAGFAKIVRSQIELNISDKLTHNFALQVGSTTEVVTVEASASGVELQSPTAAGLISGTEVRQLSLNNRNYEQMVALMPGVSSGASDQIYVGTSNPSGQANTVSFSINGARNSANNWTVDGADNVDRGSNLTLLNYPSVDAIAEFKVLRGLYSAEYGRGAGQINVVTRSGASKFHGDAYEFVRNDAFAANDYFRKRSTNSYTANHPAPLRYNNFGYTVGGPVYIPGVYNEKKDKTFFFFSQEYRRVITSSSNSTLLPTSTMKGGVFASDVCLSGYVAKTSTTPASCAQILTAGTPLPANLLSPVAAAYLKDIWSAAPNPDNTTNFSTNIAGRNKFNYRQELARIDHVFNSKLTVFGRYLHDSIPTEEPFALFGPKSLIPGVANSKTNSPGKNYVVRATYTLTPSLLLEGGYNYSYGGIKSSVTGLIDPANSPDVAAAIKGSLPYAVSLSRIPTVSIGGFTSVNGYGPYDEKNTDHNVFGTLSWLKGKHSFRFGATFHNYSKTENAADGNQGSFSFDSTGISGVYASATATQGNAQAWANFLMGKASNFTQVSADITPFIRMHQFEVFGQDEWRITPRLTMSYGLRYSYFPQPFNDNSQVLSNFDPSRYNSANAVPIDLTTGNYVANAAKTGPISGDVLNGVIFASGLLKNSPYGSSVGESSLTNFAPRIGFAFDPFGDGKTAIRTGYGMFYQSTLVGTYEQAMFANPPYGTTLSLPNVSFSSPSGTSSAALVPKALRGVQVSGDTPYTQQWSLDVQHDLGSGYMFDIGYYGSKDTHLLGIVDLNQPTPGAYLQAGISTAALTSGNATRINAIRPYKGFGAINTIVPWFSGNYNSLQGSFEKRFKGASLVKVNYTWSHALTTAQSDRSSAPQNTYNIAAEYGPSALDRRHILTATYVYEVPFMKDQKGFVGHVLGGWQTSGILSIGTGVPLTVTGNVVSGTSSDAAGQGCILGSTVCSMRPNLVSDPNAAAPHTVASWFDHSTSGPFQANTNLGVPGTSGRGVVTGPGYWRTDMSLFKQIKLTEQLGMQLRFETFNVFNHENYSGVNTTFGNALFGQVTSSRDPRIIQLGAKLNF